MAQLDAEKLVISGVIHDVQLDYYAKRAAAASSCLA